MDLLEKERREKLLENYNMTGELGLTDKQELRAFYNGDFLNARNLTVGDMMFYVDESEEYFVLPLEETIKYPVETVLYDTDFILILFDNVEDVPFGEE